VLVVEGGGSDVVVLLPGFMNAASSYSALAGSLAESGITVVVGQLYRRGVGALAGRVPVSAEACAASDLVRTTAAQRPGCRVHLAGHSRGGQAAWLAAATLVDDGLPASLVLIDPVDGEGRRTSVPVSTATDAAFDVPALVIGAGVGGRCAPEGVNHEQFARATPAARHVVVDGLGHADMLDDRQRAVGRRLCSGGPDPDAARATLAALIAAWVAAVVADQEPSSDADPAADSDAAPSTRPRGDAPDLPAIPGTHVLR
jgi:pimeloyl-ACP methyl ester carboxylesterase